MKIKLNESKEELPISFLTAFVSDGWDKVGNLKDEITAIRKEFAGTKKVEDVIQDLIDAYLVCIGRMEAYLEDKNYIEYPDESKLDEIKESLTEAILPEEPVAREVEKAIIVNDPELDAIKDDFNPIDLVPEDNEIEVDVSEKSFDNAFDMDFDAPIGEKLTDDDLYPQQYDNN